MALNCFKCTDPLVKDFTVLYVHVLSVSHPSALQGTAEYAKELVANFFRNHTRVNPEIVESHASNFIGLKAGSKLEIAFEGHPRRYKAPNYKVYKYQRAEGLVAFFEVEVRIVQRFIPPDAGYDQVEIERTDYLPLYGVTEPRESRQVRYSVRESEPTRK